MSKQQPRIKHIEGLKGRSRRGRRRRRGGGEEGRRNGREWESKGKRMEEGKEKMEEAKEDAAVLGSNRQSEDRIHEGEDEKEGKRKGDGERT